MSRSGLKSHSGFSWDAVGEWKPNVGLEPKWPKPMGPTLYPFSHRTTLVIQYCVLHKQLWRLIRCHKPSHPPKQECEAHACFFLLVGIGLSVSLTAALGLSAPSISVHNRCLSTSWSKAYSLISCAHSLAPLTQPRSLCIIWRFLHSVACLLGCCVSSTLTFRRAKFHPHNVAHESKGIPQAAWPTRWFTWFPLDVETA